MLQYTLLAVVALISLQIADAFSIPFYRSASLSQSVASRITSRWSDGRSRLLASSSGNEELFEDEEEEQDERELIAKEKLFRELMAMDDSEGKSNKQKPKGKQKSIKKPHDNRDNLPFLVQVLTPPREPYKVAKKKTKKKGKRKRNRGDDDDDDGSVVGETLGEFKFEKNTSSGDKIEIDNQVYLVTRAKCQYRYAGAQKFEMVRKILLVKPVQRAMQEEYILRQFNAPSARRESD